MSINKFNSEGYYDPTASMKRTLRERLTAMAVIQPVTRVVSL